MPTPAASNHERLLGILGDVIGLLDVPEFRPGLLRALRDAIPVDWISFNDIGPQSVEVLIEPPFQAAAHRIFARHAHENPLLQHHQRTGDGRAYRFSDVCTSDQLHATALYREFYGPIGLEHQIAFTLPAEPGRVLGIALSRRRPDFSDRERDLLNLARPFLIQAFRNAIEHSAMAAELELRRRAPRLSPLNAKLVEQLAAQNVTRREAEALTIIAGGVSDLAAADMMGISERTLQKHLQRCYRKLGVNTRAQATALAWALSSAPDRVSSP